MTEVIDDQHPQSAARLDPWVAWAACNRSVLSTNMSVSSYDGSESARALARRRRSARRIHAKLARGCAHGAHLDSVVFSGREVSSRALGRAAGVRLGLESISKVCSNRIYKVGNQRCVERFTIRNGLRSQYPLRRVRSSRLWRLNWACRPALWPGVRSRLACQCFAARRAIGTGGAWRCRWLAGGPTDPSVGDPAIVAAGPVVEGRTRRLFWRSARDVQQGWKAAKIRDEATIRKLWA